MRKTDDTTTSSWLAYLTLITEAGGNSYPVTHLLENPLKGCNEEEAYIIKTVVESQICVSGCGERLAR